MQTKANAIGVGTPLETEERTTAIIEISGTFVGTIEFDVQGPAGGWYPRNAKQAGTGTISTTATTPGLYVVDTRGCQAVQASITSYTSGAINAVGVMTDGTSDDFISLAGSNAPLPSQTISDIGSYNQSTQTFTAGNQTIAAGASYNCNNHNIYGNNEVGIYVLSDSTSTSTSWQAYLDFVLPSTGTVDTVNGNSVAAAGAGSSKSLKNDIEWATARTRIVNSDATHSLVVKYAGLFLK